jgi:hypothetical protein
MLTPTQKVGYSTSLTSRLVQRASFATPESRTELLSALMAASGAPAPDAPLMIIQMTAPTATRPADLAPGRTSVTPAWREALYHVTSMGMWNWNATKQDIMGVYDRTSRLMDNVRKVTPDAAYLVSLVLVSTLASFPFVRVFGPRASN